MILLYDQTERLFNNNGIGALADAVDCTVLQELNGSYELELQYPVGGVNYDALAQRAIIMTEADPVSGLQPFRIYRITKPLDGVVTVYARHIAYDLAGVPVSPFTARSASDAMSALKNYAAVECPFSFWTDKSTAATMSVTVPTAIWSLLGGTQGSVLDTYGGEYEFDKWAVKLHNQRGTDRGVSIRYGKNLTSLEQDENCANCYTGVYPYWVDSEGNHVELSEKIVNADGSFGYVKILPLDLTQSFQTQPTEDQLRAKAQKYIKDNDIGKPTVSLKVGFVMLEQTKEYKGLALLERVLLGDYVSVDFYKLGVSSTARAVATTYKPILKRYEDITLGSVRANIADTIAQQNQEIQRKPEVSMIQSMVATLTATILGARGGAVRMLDTDGDGLHDTLYIGDNADPGLAKKVWRFNYEGWATSKTGYNGPFVMGATLENGILAAFVTAANLVAGSIQSKDGKTFFLDLDSGILRMQATEFSISGKTVDTIAQEKANTAESNAKSYASSVAGTAENNAKAYANSAAANAVNAQTQTDIFNKLTNNGQDQGIYMVNGKLYINLQYLKAGSFTSSASVFLEPGQEEFDTIKAHILGTSTISSSRVSLYDFDNSGAIGITDLTKCKQAMLGQISLSSWSGAKKSTVTVTIDASNTAKPIKISGTNMWGRVVEYYIGFSGANIGTIPGNLAVGGKLAVGGNADFSGPFTLTEGIHYGTSLPADCTAGRLFLKKV